MRPDYPFGSQPLVPVWTSRKAQALAACAILAAASATWTRWPLALAAMDDWALRVLFPAMLAFVLAFAPQPATIVGCIAKDLTVAAILVAIFIGGMLPVLLACYPVLLAASVVIGETALGRRVWETAS